MPKACGNCNYVGTIKFPKDYFCLLTQSWTKGTPCEYYQRYFNMSDRERTALAIEKKRQIDEELHRIIENEKQEGRTVEDKTQRRQDRIFQVKLIILGSIIGCVTGIIGTLGIQAIQNENLNKGLHRKLFAEIGHNSQQGSIMEVSGKFKKFETSAWDKFFGSDAFYGVPVEIRRPLESYYLVLKLYNNELFEWKQLNKKVEHEMTVKELTNLTKDYRKFLLDKKIIKPEQILSEQDIAGINIGIVKE